MEDKEMWANNPVKDTNSASIIRVLPVVHSHLLCFALI